MAVCTEYIGSSCALYGMGSGPNQAQSPPAAPVDMSYCMAAAGAAHSCAEQAKTEPWFFVLLRRGEAATVARSECNGAASGTVSGMDSRS